MKPKYIMGATALSLILAGTAYPQQEQEKEKQQQEEQKPAEKPKTQQKQEQPSAKRQQQDQKNEQKQERQSARQNEQQKSDQNNKQRQDQERQLTKQQQEDQKQQQQESVAKQQRTDEQRNDQRSGGGHGRIPDNRFRASFGREHHFRVGHIDSRRFQYGGYWFTFNDTWPREWAYTDDFYIDYIDGQYYLIDLTHPGVQLLLVVE